MQLDVGSARDVVVREGGADDDSMGAGAEGGDEFGRLPAYRYRPRRGPNPLTLPMTVTLIAGMAMTKHHLLMRLTVESTGCNKRSIQGGG
jgi:hypothetical protein